ncbi:RNase adapter RapZ [Zhenpiania hominis]|uniref:RNase adapter RapZ n=1 Tax=Zhenpiania hominis TaxID=2763644 RepID=A0A923SR80_9FIRM|nr:RNase adapter RapZ [Zhenpiania hominis]MBC6680381.1 RNase adapter RapZ [Zhenpiania hominis]
MNTVIVTGLSGAGKTQAMNCLEDLGYYCVDNMPPALIKSFVQLAAGESTPIEKAAFAVDVRGGELFADMEKALEDLEASGINYKILYLEASELVLIRRYSETRRQHPLARGESTLEGLKRETEMLKNLRARADYIIDTSNMKVARLWEEVKDLITSGESEKTFVLNVMSFGYKRGMPLGADMVFDMRFVPNPYYVKSLRSLTGNNKKVRDYVMKQEVARDFMDRTEKMLLDLIPYYMKEGKYSLNLAFGCTGGQHRSVSAANEMADRLRAKGKRVTVEHRDL